MRFFQTELADFGHLLYLNYLVNSIRIDFRKFLQKISFFVGFGFVGQPCQGQQVQRVGYCARLNQRLFVRGQGQAEIENLSFLDKCQKSEL